MTPYLESGHQTFKYLNFLNQSITWNLLEWLVKLTWIVMADAISSIRHGDIIRLFTIGCIVILSAERENQDESDLNGQQVRNVASMEKEMLLWHSCFVEFFFQTFKPVSTTLLNGQRLTLLNEWRIHEWPDAVWCSRFISAHQVLN